MKTIFEALKEAYGGYPLKTHNEYTFPPYSFECSVCEETINVGEEFYDGGLGKRAHEECVNPILI